MYSGHGSLPRVRDDIAADRFFEGNKVFISGPTFRSVIDLIFFPFLWITSQPDLLTVSSHQTWRATLYIQKERPLTPFYTRDNVHPEYEQWDDLKPVWLDKDKYREMTASHKGLPNGQGIGRLSA